MTVTCGARFTEARTSLSVRRSSTSFSSCAGLLTVWVRLTQSVPTHAAARQAKQPRGPAGGHTAPRGVWRGPPLCSRPDCTRKRAGPDPRRRTWLQVSASVLRVHIVCYGRGSLLSRRVLEPNGGEYGGRRLPLDVSMACGCPRFLPGRTACGHASGRFLLARAYERPRGGLTTAAHHTPPAPPHSPPSADARARAAAGHQRAGPHQGHTGARVGCTARWAARPLMSARPGQ